MNKLKKNINSRFLLKISPKSKRKQFGKKKYTKKSENIKQNEKNMKSVNKKRKGT